MLNDNASDLHRISQLRDCAIKLNSPKTYFQADDDKFSNPIKRRYFVDLERDFQGLDVQAWEHLKNEACPRLRQRDSKRGWQQLFDILNEAKGYNYLKRIGCTDIRFVPRASTRTPDLQAALEGAKVLCDVKTINISKDEAERRTNHGVGTITRELSNEFFKKLSDDIQNASSQMHAFNSENDAHRIIYVVVNFDDNLHEYAEDYRTQIEAHLASLSKSSAKIVLDIKPAFYSAQREDKSQS